MSPQSMPQWCAHKGLGGDGWRLQGLVAQRADPPRRMLCTTSRHYSCTAGEEMHADINRTDIRHFTWARAWGMHIHPCVLFRSHIIVRVCQKLPCGCFLLLESLRINTCPFIMSSSDGVKSFIQEVYMHTVKLSYGRRHGQLSGLLLPAYKHGRGLLVIFFDRRMFNSPTIGHSMHPIGLLLLGPFQLIMS